MKIAIPSRGHEVDDHFGHCEAFTVFSIDGNENMISSEIILSPKGCGCKSNIGAILKQKGVTVMLAGNMGDGALNVLMSHGINVYRGNTGDVNKLINAFLHDEVNDSGEGCHQHEHHEEEHQCAH